MTSTIKIQQLALVALLAALLISCNAQNNADVNRAVAVFFLGVLQVINLILFGSTALVLCIVSANSAKPIYKVLGGVFLGIFAIFTLLGFLAVTAEKPRHFDIYILFIVEFLMILIAFIFVLKKPSKKSNEASKEMVDSVEEVL